MDKPKTLREQIERIACTEIGPEWYKAAGFHKAVTELCAKAFLFQWEESDRTRALRRAATLLRCPGWVNPHEPPVG